MAETSTDSIQQLFMRLHSEGTDVPILTSWRDMSLAAILLTTESEAKYVVEPTDEPPCLITRFSEAPPFYGEFRLPSSEMILRKPGNPDLELKVGQSVDIFGLPRIGFEFDPDSIYTTMPLVEIKFLEAE